MVRQDDDGRATAATTIYMDDPQYMEQNLRMADITPKALLVGEPPILLDEWQLAPKLWDTIRFEVDHHDGTGLFILTGSAVPAQTDEMHHSGAGRFTWLTMRPMSLYESGESTGEVSLEALFDTPEKSSWKCPAAFERLYASFDEED